MPRVLSATIHAFYLFDVAQGIDLQAIRRQFGPQAAPATLQDKSPGPPKVRYFTPPVVIDGSAIGIARIDGFSVRIKAYDYGVLSLMLSRSFQGDWSEFVRDGQTLIENEALERRASDAAGQLIDRLRECLTGLRSSFLTEDYAAFVVHAFDRPMPADRAIEAIGPDIAQLLRGERLPLSQQERDEVLRHRLSYLTDDLVVPAYNAAFLLDSEAGAQGALEILEYVNSQLLEFRYHDEQLESELTRIYAVLQAPRWKDRLLGRRATRAARRLHSLFVDVNELSDRMENAVKLVGDIYSARLFGLAGARLGLDAWKRNVEDKLETLDDIYRFAVEQTGISQGNLLELVIVLILVLELGLFFAGIMN